MATVPSAHKVVCFGEVLWDVLPTASLPGGAPMNVAYHLKMLGNHPTLITRIGNDDKGAGLKKILDDSGVDTSFFQTDAQHKTGVVIASPNEKNEVTYDIVQPVAWDFIEWQEGFTSLMNNAECFVCGSLAARNTVSRETLYRLLDMAKFKVVDINLRPPHFDKPVVEYLLAKADILKLNNAELQLLADWYNQTGNDEATMRFLENKFSIPTIIVTLGESGAMVMHGGKVFRHPGFKVTVRDTIGSGDAFLAGFLHKVLNGAPVEEALAFACSIGSLIATFSGACPKYDVAQIEAQMHGRNVTTE